jgi:Domain of unknown function (DUF4062)
LLRFHSSRAHRRTCRHRALQDLVGSCLRDGEAQHGAMKVFISSVIGGFTAYREAAASAIRSLGHDPKRAEDYGSSPSSPQQVCLAGIRDAQVVVLLLGDRYGEKQPSGLSATHEEYREARQERKDILAFVEKVVAPELEQQAFIQEVRDWVEGQYTQDFSGTDELREAVTGRLHYLELVESAGRADEAELLSRARAAIPEAQQHGVPTLYVTVAGGPRRQVVSPMDLEQERLHRKLIQIAASETHQIFDFRSATRIVVEREGLLLEQERSFIRLDELGTITVRQLAQNHSNGARLSSMESMFLVREDVEARSVRALGFVGEVFDELDGPRRLTDVVVTAAILGAQYQTWRSQHEQHENSGRASMYQSRRPSTIVTLQPPIRRRAALRAKTVELAIELATRLRREMER